MRQTGQRQDQANLNNLDHSAIVAALVFFVPGDLLIECFIWVDNAIARSS